jgi:8-oxo-dGTP diphosphatase
MPNTGPRPEAATAVKPFLYIAVGVLRTPDGRVLIAERLPDKPGAGKWEFPGGKREDGEAVAAALARELNEELGIRVRETRPLLRFSHEYSDRRVLLDIHEVTAWDGEAHGREGQTLAWCRPEDLFDYDLLSANTPVVAALRLPDRYLITPEPGDDREVFLGCIDRALGGARSVDSPGEFQTPAAAIRLLRLRAWNLDDDAYEELARALQRRAAAHGAALLLDRDAAMAERIGAAGLHLPANTLDELTRRPLPKDRWFAVSCHDRGQLQRALLLGADFATLSPVLETPTHPDAAPLGWDGFAATRADLAIPVYALGGLSPADLGPARKHGAQGIAAIRTLWPKSQ